MEITEHLKLMLSKHTNGKASENYLVNAIYWSVGNPNLVPITQKYVRVSGVYYLIDLYFPQLKLGVEINEPGHARNISHDRTRHDQIMLQTGIELLNLDLFDIDTGKEYPYNEIYHKLMDTVKRIKIRIKEVQKNSGPLKWKDNNDYLEDVKSRGVFATNDAVSYKGITELLNILGYHYKGYRRCFKALNDNYAIWVPFLETNGKHLGEWINRFDGDDIVEEHKGEDLLKDSGVEKLKRVVFMRMKDAFGVWCVKFIGVYSMVKQDGNFRRYSKIADKIDFDCLEK